MIPPVNQEAGHSAPPQRILVASQDVALRERFYDLLTGCEGLRAAARSKSVQGTVLGGLLGAGTFALIGSVSDHHSGLGGWLGIGGAVGAFMGWCLGHQLEAKPHIPPQ